MTHLGIERSSTYDRFYLDRFLRPFFSATVFSSDRFFRDRFRYTAPVCRRPSVSLSVVCLSSVVCNVHAPYSGYCNVSTLFGTLAIYDLSIKILRRSSQGNPSVGRVKHTSDFGPYRGYISETVQDRS